MSDKQNLDWDKMTDDSIPSNKLLAQILVLRERLQELESIFRGLQHKGKIDRGSFEQYAHTDNLSSKADGCICHQGDWRVCPIHGEKKKEEPQPRDLIWEGKYPVMFEKGQYWIDSYHHLVRPDEIYQSRRAIETLKWILNNFQRPITNITYYIELALLQIGDRVTIIHKGD